MKSLFLTRVLAASLSISLACLPLHSMVADVQRQSGLSGQQAGQQLLQNWRTPELSGNTLTLPTGSGTESINLHQLFPAMDQGSLDILTGVYGSNANMNQLGTEHQASMASENSVTGEAFRSLQQIKERSRPDMTNDPLWALTDALQTDPNLLTQGFPECQTEQTATANYQQCDRLNRAVNSCTITHDYTAGIIEHISGPMNLRSCGEGCLELWIGRIGDNYWSGRCKIFEQAITLKVVNPDAIRSAVLEYAKWDDYMQVWLGNQKVWSGANNHFPPETSGRCELSTSWQTNPNTDVTARLKTAKPGLELPLKIRVSVTGSGEGYARIKIRFDPSKVVMNDIWSPASCINQLYDIKHKFSDYSIECTDQPFSTNGCTMVNGVSVCEPYFAPNPLVGISPLCRRVQVSVDNDSNKTIENQACQLLEENSLCGFISSQCAETNNNGECVRFTDTYDCGLQTTDPKCVVSNLLPSSFEACKTTQTITLFTETNHLPDHQVCEKITKLTPSHSDSMPASSAVLPNSQQKIIINNCSALEQNRACKHVRTECIDGGIGDDGFCYMQSLLYDCGQSVEVQNARMQSQYHCDGAVRCMGSDCLEPESIKQANFAEAAAMLNVAQFMTNDMSCTGTDGQDNVECRVFKGSAGQCKKAVSGIVDCCEKPSGVSLSDYITMIVAVNKLDSAVMAMDPSSAIYGSWSRLRAPISTTWSVVKQPFVSAWDSLMGAVPSTAADAGAEQAATAFMQLLTNKTAEWVGSTFGAGAQSMLFSNLGGAVGANGVVSGGNFALASTAGTVLSTVMTAYMIYSVTMILIQLIWQCEQSEFEMNAKRVLKSCHYVGSYCQSKFLGACVEKQQSYCCFSSPLSRIIQQQVRPQLGLGWGSAKSPNCEGLMPSQLNQVDWSQVNLDEWIAILSMTGNMPEIPSLDLERLTGSGSTLNIDGSRQSAAERAVERLDGIDGQKLRQQATQEVSENN